MPVQIAFLRGINVGGNTLIKMAALKEMFEAVGFKDAQTLLQSGNVVFTTKATPEAVAKKISAAIRRTFGVNVEVMVRTADDLRKVAKANPFAVAARDDPGHLVVTFLTSEPSAEAVKLLYAHKNATEKFEVRGPHMYAHYPSGIGTSKFNPSLIERTLKVGGTGRNWNTVTKLIALADQLEP